MSVQVPGDTRDAPRGNNLIPGKPVLTASSAGPRPEPEDTPALQGLQGGSLSRQLPLCQPECWLSGVDSWHLAKAPGKHSQRLP